MENLRTFTRVIAGTMCECVEAQQHGKMRLKLEASFGDGYNVCDLILIPIEFPDDAITVLSDFWLSEKEKELGLPVGYSCNSHSWWAGYREADLDHLLTEKYHHLYVKAVDHLNTIRNGGCHWLNIYFDKNGNQILSGMTISHNSGDSEVVYATQDQNGIEDLGINAISESWRTRHSDYDDEFYPLSEFDLNEWVVVSTC